VRQAPKTVPLRIIVAGIFWPVVAEPTAPRGAQSSEPNISSCLDRTDERLGSWSLTSLFSTNVSETNDDGRDA